MDELVQTLAVNVKKFREKRKLTQSRAEELSELPAGMWSRIESGKAISLATLYRIAVVLAVPAWQLIKPAKSSSRS